MICCSVFLFAFPLLFCFPSLPIRFPFTFSFHNMGFFRSCSTANERGRDKVGRQDGCRGWFGFDLNLYLFLQYLLRADGKELT